MLMASSTRAAQFELTGDPPTTNTDGTPLGDLAGYKIYYGQSSGNYTVTVNVGNVTSYPLPDLAEGKTYYFAATAYDVSGNESGFSNEVSAEVPPSQPPPPPPADTSGQPFQQGSGSYGLVTMEVENAHTNIPQGDHSWTRTALPGASGTGAMEATPNIGATLNTNYAATSPRLDFQVTFLRTGTHYVWVRGLGPSGSDDSVHVGLNGQALATSDRLGSFAPSWTWVNTTMDGVPATIEVPTPGTHTVNVWMREDGFVFDKLMLTTTATYTPTNTRPAESPRTPPPAPVAAMSPSTVSAPAASGTTAPTTGSLTVTPGMALVTSPPLPVVVKPPEAVMLWLEAEEGLRSGLMEIGLDDEASSGRYLWVLEGKEMALDPSQSNSEVRYTFTVSTADLYVIWGHVRPRATGTGSFFITLESGTSSSVGAGAEIVTDSDYAVWTLTSNAEMGTATVTPAAGIVTDVVPTSYQVAPVQVGDRYYIDRTYTLTAMPDELVGSLAIKTPNSSKDNAAATFLTFTVTQDATLYVAYDARTARYPDWLTASFTQTDQVLQTTDTALMLWKRTVSAGPVVLPGNQYGNPVGVHSNYVILVAFPPQEPTSPRWMWDQAASDSMPVFFLEPGEHTLIIKQRESGSQLDQLLITNNIEYQP